MVPPRVRTPEMQSLIVRFEDSDAVERSDLEPPNRTQQIMILGFSALLEALDLILYELRRR